eukprot:6958827-Pyramimonas_sp.AAC.2
MSSSAHSSENELPWICPPARCSGGMKPPPAQMQRASNWRLACAALAGQPAQGASWRQMSVTG